MGYTRRKIRGINFSFLLAGIVFAGWAFVCAWFGWPRGFRYGSTAGFALFAVASVFFTAFPLIWARYPEKHPVNHELARYGNLREVSQRLDREMADHFETLGPFRFTATMMVYDSGHEFQMIPYDQILSAEVATADVPHSSSTPATAATTSGTAPGCKEFSTRRTSSLKSAPPPTWTTQTPPSPQCPPWSKPFPVSPVSSVV